MLFRVVFLLSERPAADGSASSARPMNFIIPKLAVSREHRRAKTDRLDMELLMRAFLGWLRGEMRHCSMVAIATIEEEDARRLNRERQTLVTEQTRIVNQMKVIFARFGIRTFRLTLRTAEEKREGLRTAEGTPASLGPHLCIAERKY